MLRNALLNVLQNDAYIKKITRKGRPIRSLQFFSYAVEIPTTAPPVSVSRVITTHADSDFVLAYISAFWANQGTTESTLDIFDGASNQSFFNGPIHIASVIGNFGRPFVLIAPRIFPPNTDVTVTVNAVANNGGVSNNYQFAFHGTQIVYG